MVSVVFQYVSSYIPDYQKHDLKWYERDSLLSYYDQLKYKQFSSTADKWLSDVQVVS